MMLIVGLYKQEIRSPNVPRECLFEETTHLSRQASRISTSKHNLAPDVCDGTSETRLSSSKTHEAEDLAPSINSGSDQIAEAEVSAEETKQQ